jgi:hypothetical protein
MKYGVCTYPKFTNTNIISGVIEYKEARDIRKDKEMCGTEGKYYEKDGVISLVSREINMNFVYNCVLVFLVIYISLLVYIIMSNKAL